MKHGQQSWEEVYICMVVDGFGKLSALPLVALNGETRYAHCLEAPRD